MYKNPFKTLTKKEWTLWLLSLCIVLLSNLFSKSADTLSVVSTLIGVTSLIFLAKGDVLGQILMCAFSVLYAIISFGFAYHGEMITYLGMT